MFFGIITNVIFCSTIKSAPPAAAGAGVSVFSFSFNCNLFDMKALVFMIVAGQVIL